MPKRFTDTDKWKKPFIRGLQGAYKLLWLYILDDCDHAGIWAVDFEVARIRIGEPGLDRDHALRVFGDRIEVLNKGTKWFLRDFIDFQYGALNEKNRMHASVINLLTKNEIKPLTSPLQGVKDKDKEQDKDKVKDKDTGENENWFQWGKQILDENDPIWESMHGRLVTQDELDTFYSVAIRNEWSMETQQDFRRTLKGFKVDGHKPTQIPRKKSFDINNL
jgi:hypothetical protein